jgi:hypothetical protein
MRGKALRRVMLGLALLVSASQGLGSKGELQGSFSEQRIQFARGSHSATVRGRVRQDKAVLYKVSAKAGQSMAITLDGDAKTRFDLSGPKDESGQSMASGETEWTGRLPDDGAYKILVMTEDRVDAPYTLTVTIK